MNLYDDYYMSYRWSLGYYVFLFLAGTVKSRGNDDHSFITEIVLNDVVDVTFFYLKLQSTTEKVIIELGKKFPTEKGSVDIPAWRNEVHIEDNIVAPTDTNTNMTIDVSLTVDLNFLHMLNQSSESVTDLVNEKIDMLLAGINTTANPHKLYPVSGESFFINVKSIGETIINLSVYIPAEYVQYGCLFGLNVFENVSTNFISKLEHGMYIKVLSPVTNVVIPEGVIAMHPFPHETYIYTKRTTLTCFSMGNPHPEATLYKQGQGQEYISLKSKQEKLISSDVSLTVGYTVEANDTDNQGRYMCR